MKRTIGKVYLVGAGPGDPGLITVRGRECLASAEVVLYDALANEQLLRWAPKAECISVGKHGQTPIWTQADINLRMIELARQGKTVVRLKGGDPAVFARTAEEVDVLVAAGVDYEIVPGITAALAAASYTGIPITHRHHASAVAFVTGQQQSGSDLQEADWLALSQFPGTLVLYMGVTTVGDWTARLMAAGKSPQTPAAIIRRCTWDDQTVIRCQLADVASNLTPASRMRPPVIVIVGPVAQLGEHTDWFARRPLHGCGVLVTRAAEQSDELLRRLREAGAEVYHQSVFEVQPPQSFDSVDSAIAELSGRSIQGITFSSANGVDCFLQRMFASGFDARSLASVRLAVVGPATAKALQCYGLKADVLPCDEKPFSASGLLDELSTTVAGQTWVVTTTTRSQDTLPIGLAKLGARVKTALCYETRPVSELTPDVQQALAAKKIDFATITSPFVAEATFALLREHLGTTAPVSFSAAITERLQELQWPAAAEASQATIASLVEAITNAFFCKRTSIPTDGPPGTCQK